MKSLNKKAEETDKSLSQSFSDLSALMQKAKEMVALAERFATAQQKESKEKEGKEKSEEDEEFRNYLLQMGISSPVTKKTAGSLYHTELSRQLSDWLKNVLAMSTTKMLPLPDLYCFFNRARGTELISPEDLYRACVLFEELDLPIRLRKFESGVLVVQFATHNDKSVAEQMKQLLEAHGPLTALSVSSYTKVSPALALEQLQTAENYLYLCRDETFEGLIFYPNKFVEYVNDSK